jgi:hypothetical protein
MNMFGSPKPPGSNGNGAVNHEQKLKEQSDQVPAYLCCAYPLQSMCEWCAHPCF